MAPSRREMRHVPYMTGIGESGAAIHAYNTICPRGQTGIPRSAAPPTILRLPFGDTRVYER